MGFNVNKTKVNLKLATARIKLLTQKKVSIGQHQRREIANLLQEGKVASAEVRVEHIIREDYNMEAMEMLELMCDLLLARIGLLAEIKYCDESIAEAVNTILYASHRSEIKELKMVRDQLVGKFGRDYCEQAINNRLGLVNPRVVQRLKVQAPDQALVDSYLMEIAKSFNVNYTPPARNIVEPALIVHEPEPLILLDERQQFAAKSVAKPMPNIPVVTSGRPLNVGTQKFHNNPSSASSSSSGRPTIPKLPGDDESDDQDTHEEEQDLQTPKASDSKNIAKSQEAFPSAPTEPLLAPEPEQEDEPEAPDFDALSRRFEELKRRK